MVSITILAQGALKGVRRITIGRGTMRLTEVDESQRYCCTQWLQKETKPGKKRAPPFVGSPFAPDMVIFQRAPLRVQFFE